MRKAASLPLPATRAAQRSALQQFFSDMFAGIQEGREIAVRYHALTRLSPGGLASRGLSRQDVTRAALTGLPSDAGPRLH